MCSIAGASLALSAIGTGMSAMGQVNQANAQSQAAAYQAQVARNNQIIADQNAKVALDAGRVQEQNQRLKTAALIGSQRAAIAGSGLDANTGSAVDLQSDAAMLGEQDARTIYQNAKLKAYGYETQASSQGAQAGLLDTQAANAQSAGTLGVMTSLISGASTVSDKWSKWISTGSGSGTTIQADNPLVAFS
ncbi:MAG: hypothetical protein HQL37_03565 [Alphaproteobacteria bacterium]|nr:hypothetical protein [Alphaproteobacteria bacterium]